MAVAVREVFSLNDNKIVELFLQAKHLQGLSPLSIKGYKLELKNYVNFINNQIGKSILEVKPADIRLYLAERSNLKPASLSRKIAILKSFYKFLVNEDYTDVNVMDKINSPKVPKSLPKFLTLDEMDKIREACKTIRDKAIIELFYSSGMRLSELQSLNRSDIRFEERKILVTGKGSKQRIVRFSKRAADYLKEYLTIRNDNNPALFLSQRGDRISKRALQHLIRKLGEQAGLERRVHPHRLRHTFCSMAVQNGMKLQAVQELAGHSNISTTTIYARLTDELLDKEYEKLPQ